MIRLLLHVAMWKSFVFNSSVIFKKIFKKIVFEEKNPWNTLTQHATQGLALSHVVMSKMVLLVTITNVATKQVGWFDNNGRDRTIEKNLVGYLDVEFVTSGTEIYVLTIWKRKEGDLQVLVIFGKIYCNFLFFQCFSRFRILEIFERKFFFLRYFSGFFIRAKRKKTNIFKLYFWWRYEHVRTNGMNQFGRGCCGA